MRAFTCCELSPEKTSTSHMATKPRSDADFLMSIMSVAFGRAIALIALRLREEVATYKQPASNKYQTAVRWTEPSSFWVPRLAIRRPVRNSSAPDGIVLGIWGRPSKAGIIH